MDNLTEAIKQHYKRQQELILKQNALIDIVTNALMGQIPSQLGWHLTDAVRDYYRPELEQVNAAIKVLEAVRDAE